MIVPAESIARFHCVSKLWRSILRHRHDFTELFMARSITRPRLLFTFKVEDKLLIFSSTQPQNVGGDNCSLVATRYKDFPKHFPTENRDDLSNGLACLHGPGRGRRVPIVVTPSRENLAKVKAAGTERSYIGYDPIKKSRSTIECKRHTGQYGEICINAVLKSKFDRKEYIACYDFRFEKFSFIERDSEMYSLFIQLQSLTTTGLKKKLVLWVLEDAEKHKWSKSIFVLSHLYNEKIGHKCYIVGITSAGEIVFMPVGHVNPNFHLFFYNMERDTCTTVNIKGFEEFKHHSLHITTYLDYVENMMPL
ncbi:LOW QUALITY PROTEIN: hypothetical protein HID58_028323 [Brassica napus]|uniref:F-box associated beta-propeller type 3 domain-containing protein n=1 Tax=Brassica napus TaxID=3708 RepID=A0ABQ8C9X4_BRANA|nr:LOW QUALITY PROTEIN: hypothetical protein HID58_028323 [Brassica napus]